MATPFQWEAYREVLLFLATGGVVVPLFHRIHVSPVLGFLLAGVLLGPFGLGRLAHSYAWLQPLTIGEVEAVSKVAEFGVVFLLFLIGLELSWERLARMRLLVFGLGLLQVALSTAVLAPIGRFWFGLETSPAVIMGAALAMSSTAIVIPVLVERRRLVKTAGRIAFSVLLLQDLMVAPLLFLISFLSGASDGQSGLTLVYAFVPAVIALALFIAFGRLLLRPLFRLVAAARSTELFMAACLLVIIGSGVASAAFGFSMGLGAFAAGLLLAETEFRREIEVTIEPFKGLLLGLFFVSIGAGLDIGVILREPAPLLFYACVLIALKAALMFLLAFPFRLGAPASAEAALLLASGGEFAFVLLGQAISANVLPFDPGARAMVVVTLTMFAVPALARAGESIAQRKQRAEEPEAQRFAPETGMAAGRVLIVGYGRVGAIVGDMLQRQGIGFAAVDSSVKLVTAKRDEGVEIYWGDAARREFLRRCGAEQARALIVTVENPRVAEEIVRLARAERPDMTIIARARDARHARNLYELGANDAIPETIESSLQLAESVLVDLGVPMGLAIAAIHEKRDEFRKLLQPPEAGAQRKRALQAIERAAEMRKRLAARQAPLEASEE